MNVSYCIDKCEKINKLSSLLSNMNCEEAGRRFTKSYWEVQYYLDDSSYDCFKLGTNLKEEVVACLLGGYGLKAELGLLAFHRVKNFRLIHCGHTDSTEQLWFKVQGSSFRSRRKRRERRTLMVQG